MDVLLHGYTTDTKLLKQPIFLEGGCCLFSSIDLRPGQSLHCAEDILWGRWRAEDKVISQEDPQLPQSLREALQYTKPDYNLPDGSRICCLEIIHLSGPPN